MFLRLPILSIPILSAQTAAPAPAAATTATTAAAVHTNFISSHLSVETEPHLQQGSAERRGSYPSWLFGSSGSGSGGKMEVGEFFLQKDLLGKKTCDRTNCQSGFFGSGGGIGVEWSLRETAVPGLIPSIV